MIRDAPFVDYIHTFNSVTTTANASETLTAGVVYSISCVLFRDADVANLHKRTATSYNRSIA